MLALNKQQSQMDRSQAPICKLESKREERDLLASSKPMHGIRSIALIGSSAFTSFYRKTMTRLFVTAS
jgi:hypothetical protein